MVDQGVEAFTPDALMPSDTVSLDTIRMGRVARAHGLTGELEIRPDWPESRGLLDAEEVVLESADGQRELCKVTRSRQTPKGVLMLLVGIADRDAAEARRGYTVSVPRGALPALAEGEYYLCDLVGLGVFGAEGLVGHVVEIQMYPSVDAVIIQTPAGEWVEQPLLDEWVERVDFAAQRIVLASLGGLIEVPRGSRSADQSSIDSGKR